MALPVLGYGLTGYWLWPLWVLAMASLGTGHGLTGSLALEVTAASGFMFEAVVKPTLVKKFRTFNFT